MALRLAPVAVLLPLLLASACGGRSEYEAASRRRTAPIQEKNFAVAIEMYFIDTRQMPKSLQDLTVPSEKDGEPFMSRIPSDPWGTDYDYRIVNSPKREYEIHSAGVDKILGSEDDIVYRSAESGR